MESHCGCPGRPRRGFPGRVVPRRHRHAVV